MSKRLTLSPKFVIISLAWGFSSVGRASALQAEGQRFESANLHHYITCYSVMRFGCMQCNEFYYIADNNLKSIKECSPAGQRHPVTQQPRSGYKVRGRGSTRRASAAIIQ